jgi:hypothetical protein
MSHGLFAEEQLQRGYWRHQWLGKLEQRDWENGEEWQKKGKILLLERQESSQVSKKDDLLWMLHQ